MIPTTFVFGAGTSIPFEFPSGLELLRKIGRYKDGFGQNSPLDRLVRNAIPNYSFETAKHFLNDVAAGGFGSIDRLAQERPEYDGYARAFISHYILIEEEAKIHRASLKEYPTPSGRGYTLLTDSNPFMHIWNVISSSRNIIDEIRKHNFITFNYDRVFEHFLCNSFHHSLGMTQEEAVRFVNEMNILHVYGHLGEYEGVPKYKITVSTRNPTPYDTNLLQNAMNSLQLLSADRTSKKSSAIASAFIQDTKRVVILGFGYDSVNCTFLKQSYTNSHVEHTGRHSSSTWLGSAMGKRRAERDDICEMLGMNLLMLGDIEDDDVQFMKDKMSNLDKP